MRYHVQSVTVGTAAHQYIKVVMEGKSSPNGEHNVLFYRTSVEETLKLLETNFESGLTSSEAASRLEKYGKNIFKEHEKVKAHKILFHHLFNFLSIVLFVATAVSFAIQQWIDGGVLIFIIIINTMIGFVQEYKSEKTLESLRKISAPSSHVLRDSNVVEVETENIVPGDIVVLKEGDVVPADTRLFECYALECDEALLTGESVPVEKITDALEKEGTEEMPIGDRRNIAYMATIVSKGKGKGICVLTGTNTEIGKIAESLSKGKKEVTKLEKRLNKLGQILVVCAAFAVAAVILLGWAWGTLDPHPEGLIVGISTAVAIIPEGLVPVVTLTMTLGVRRMAARRAIVRKIGALESLGNISDICSDKTGTLTQGKMVATSIWTSDGQEYKVSGKGIEPTGEIFRIKNAQDDAGDPVDAANYDPCLKMTLAVCGLCNVSSVFQKEPEMPPKETGPEEPTHKQLKEEKKKRKKEAKEHHHISKSPPGVGLEPPPVQEETGGWTSTGSPTEVALLVLAMKARMSQKDVAGEWRNITEFPFDSTIKRMSVVSEHIPDHTHYLLAKGAPEGVLSLCNLVLDPDGHPLPLEATTMEYIKTRNHEMASQGLRVLCLAYKELPSLEVTPTHREDVEHDLVFLGLIGIMDPPREMVPSSIETCHKAGIVVHMVTGDHPATATAIARQVGILPPGELKPGMVMTATQFDALSDSQIDSMEQLPLVIARCSPETKVKMVEAFHRRRKLVAMTGDGVNDSPAIQKSDVGIAMGIAGSDVTKEASDIVLTDDDFSTLVVAIREGRRLFSNIRKFLVHLLAGNVAETIVLVIGIGCGLHPPIDPLQVLWLNLVTGTAPAMALGVEPATPELMDAKKRPVDEPLFTRKAICDMFVYGTFMGAITIVNFVLIEFALAESLKRAQATAFATLSFLLLAHAYNCRTLRHPFWRQGFLRDFKLHFAVALGVASVCFTFYVPVVKDDIFDQGTPGLLGWIFACCSVVVFLVCSDLYKLFLRCQIKEKKKKKGPSAVTPKPLEQVTVVVQPPPTQNQQPHPTLAKGIAYWALLRNS